MHQLVNTSLVVLVHDAVFKFQEKYSENHKICVGISNCEKSIWVSGELTMKQVIDLKTFGIDPSMEVSRAVANELNATIYLKALKSL